MKILNILCCYNSLDIMPYVLEYYRKEGIESFVLDNYSTDGSWEYLQDNKIPSMRFDTGETFSTNKNIAAKLAVIRELKPDWVIRNSSDYFILTPLPLRATIERIHKEEKYSAISMPFCRIWNIGEQRTVGDDPRNICFYYSTLIDNYVSIHKSKGFESYQADATTMLNGKPIVLGGAVVLDYGNTRSKEKRDEEYHRRQLAWERGEPRGHGVHYAPASKRGWLWEKEEFKDIRKSKYWEMVCNRFGFGKNGKP